MPVSTVSAKVAHLEDALGATLLVRTTRKLQLTEAGSRYFQRAVNACNELQAAEAAISSEQDEASGVVRLTAPIEMGSTSLTDVLADFFKAYPKVHVELLLTDRMIDLVGEGVDLAVRVGVLEDSSLMVKKIGTTLLQLYASPAYLKKHGEPKKAQSLVDHNCLNFQGATSDVWELKASGKATRIPVRGAFSANNLNSLQRLALHGTGIALLPHFLCTEDVAKGRLKHILKECSADQYPVQLVYPRQKFLSKSVRALMEFIAKNLQDFV